MDGSVQLIAAAILGAALMMALVGWVVGDVHSLPWLWGAVGERETAGLLQRLDRSWTCEHDLQRKRGNWDHVALGRQGVVIWGDFPQRRRDESGVTYFAAGELLAWLGAQPSRLSGETAREAANPQTRRNSRSPRTGLTIHTGLTVRPVPAIGSSM